MERGEDLSSKDIWLLEDKELVVMSFQKGVNQALQAVKAQSHDKPDSGKWGGIASLNGQPGRRCYFPNAHLRK